MIGLSRVGKVGFTRARATLAALCCLAAMAVYLNVLSKHQPLDTWLFWRLAILAAWLCLFCAGSIGAGSLVVERLLRGRVLPRLEAAVLAMATGVVVFVLAMYAGGACAWFGPTFAVLLMVTLALAGARSARRLLSRPGDAAEAPMGWMGMLAFSAGVIGVGVVYLGMLTPEAINYDATWSHLTIAQDYARAGRIVAFPGDYNKQVPHLASIVYSWAFMVPTLDVIGRWMLAQHLEFLLFLWTLAGIAALVRWIVKAPVRGAWGAFVLFPCIFVYDNNLGAAADHVLAFFGPAVLLAARHFFPSFDRAAGILLGLLLGGAALTKYQALYFVVPLCALLTLRAPYLVASDFRQGRSLNWRSLNWRSLNWRSLNWRSLLGLPVVVLTFFLVLSPHFIKNVVFHGNPVYPFMQRAFPSSHPTNPASRFLLENIYLDQAWVPKGTFFEKVRSSVELVFTFSLEPHYSFHGGLPMFGSLFTLLLPCILFLRGTKRLLFVSAFALGGLLVWSSTFRVDRNLQIILPLLVTATAAFIVELWRLGLIARVGLVPLVALQLIWGGDAAAYSGHPRIEDSIDLIKSTFDHREATRFDRYRQPYREIEKVLPKHARVLLHSQHASLGIDRPLVLDLAGFQALVDYSQVRNARQLHAYYLELGITHLVHTPQLGIAPSKQEEVLWHDFVLRSGSPGRTFGHLRLLELPPVAPLETPPYRVVCLGLAGYTDGLYEIADLDTNEFLVPDLRKYKAPRVPIATLEAAKASVRQADAVLVGLRGGYESRLFVDLRRFAMTGRYPGNFVIYVLRR